VVPRSLDRNARGERTLNDDVSSIDRIFGIETSCDETAAAVVDRGVVVHASVVSSQVDIHARFGGVVPEVASRAHVEMLIPVIAQAMVEAGVRENSVDAVAATQGPGLIGSLLVGVSAAKALALVWEVPFVAVNHLEAHLYASLLDDPELELPVIVLLVSGGHTMLVLMRAHGDYQVLGQTVDDAAGEAFDKVARFLGLDYPGGPAIDRLAKSGDPEAIAFPRAMMHTTGDGEFNFSFSGLKTAVVNHTRTHSPIELADVAASFQEAAVDVLVTKAMRAAEHHGAAGICLAGGVAANSRLRELLVEQCGLVGVPAHLPSDVMCTDIAAMVASAAWYQLQHSGASELDSGDYPNLGLS
jgi:N6-L-threonylcarbamoyladenine synthase